MTTELLTALKNITECAKAGADGANMDLWIQQAEAAIAQAEGRPAPAYDDDDPYPGCTNPRGHSWAYSGSAYGGDDDSYHGEGRCYCENCGADGDA
jgi:hypothetical protein